VARFGRLDLLLLDEVGYVQIDPRGAELLFQIITEREERASIGLASNLPFSEWGAVVPDPRLVAAIVGGRWAVGRDPLVSPASLFNWHRAPQRNGYRRR
jgi:DNA replication protein DnaC